MSSTSRSKPARRIGSSDPSGQHTRSRVSSLEDHLGYWLRSVSNHVSHAFKVKVEQNGVTVAEWVIMRALFDAKAMRPGELSVRVGLSKGAVSKLLDRLCRKRLVVRNADALDGRAQVVGLTELGRKLVPKLANAADLNDTEMFGHLDANRRLSLRSLL
jgi:DNA-binding MarR family transcriptional regulator